MSIKQTALVFVSLFALSSGLRRMPQFPQYEMPEVFPELGFMDALLYTPPDAEMFKNGDAHKLFAQKGNSSIPETFIWNLHFHKASDAIIGGLALHNGMKVAPYEPNSHAHLDLGFHNIRETSTDQIVERLKLLRNSGVSFGSTEYWFPDPGKLEEIQAKAPWVKFMTVLRDPMQRTISSYNFHGIGGGSRCWGKCSLEKYAHAESNLMTRMLNGFRFGPTALRQMPHELSADAADIQSDNLALSKALSVLQRFSVVAIYEHIYEEATQKLMREKLGWTAFDIPDDNLLSNGKISNDDMDTVVRQNTLDSQLYWSAQLPKNIKRSGFSQLVHKDDPVQ